MFKKLNVEGKSVEPLCEVYDNCGSRDTCIWECAFGEACISSDWGCIIDGGGDPDCQVIDI